MYAFPHGPQSKNRNQAICKGTRIAPTRDVHISSNSSPPYHTKTPLPNFPHSGTDAGPKTSTTRIPCLNPACQPGNLTAEAALTHFCQLRNRRCQTDPHPGSLNRRKRKWLRRPDPTAVHPIAGHHSMHTPHTASTGQNQAKWPISQLQPPQCPWILRKTLSAVDNRRSTCTVAMNEVLNAHPRSPERWPAFAQGVSLRIDVLDRVHTHGHAGLRLEQIHLFLKFCGVCPEIVSFDQGYVS